MSEKTNGNNTLKVKLSRDSEEVDAKRVVINVNGMQLTITAHAGEVVINKQDLEGFNDSICIKPHMGNEIKIS
ncbi:MAG: hypothetical protein AAF599_00145 [Bacteroidota bacterium]